MPREIYNTRRIIDHMVKINKSNNDPNYQLKCEEMQIKCEEIGKQLKMGIVFDLISMLIKFSYYEIAILKTLKCVTCGGVTLKEFCDSISSNNFKNSLIMVPHGTELFIRG